MLLIRSRRIKMRRRRRIGFSDIVTTLPLMFLKNLAREAGPYMLAIVAALIMMLGGGIATVTMHGELPAWFNSDTLVTLMEIIATFILAFFHLFISSNSKRKNGK